MITFTFWVMVYMGSAQFSTMGFRSHKTFRGHIANRAMRHQYNMGCHAIPLSEDE